MNVAFTGSHGTGKTTAAFKSCYELKLDYPNKKVGILYDLNRFAPKFNKNGDEASQSWIFHNRISEENKMSDRYPILVCDRTIFDVIAYSYYLTLYGLAKDQLAVAKLRINFYDKIIFKTIKNNDYLTDNNCRDVNDLNFRKDIEDILMDIYKELGITKSSKFVVV
jgi:hypothetical protein